MTKDFYPKKGRVILHIDMNCFYASVEMAEHEELRGKPLAIAGNEKERKGIIVTCSYEARDKGVKATMPLWQARKLCPDLLVRKPDFPLYKDYSNRIYEKLLTITDQIQLVSIDEGYMDITNCQDQGTPLDIANHIQKMLLEEVGIPCSIGIAPNKFLAKTASDMKKPLGITILRKRQVKEILWPLETITMHGVGKASATKLAEHNIHKIEDLAKANDTLLHNLLGKNGLALKERANGIDDRPVDPSKMFEIKTIGNSYTFPHDIHNEIEIMGHFDRLCQKVSQRLKKQQVHAYNIQITLRYKSRKTVHRSKTLDTAIQDYPTLLSEITSLWRTHWDGDDLRLVGVTASNLVENTEITTQLDLFTFQKEVKHEPILKVIHSINDKFGKNAIQKGIQLKQRK